MKVSFLFDQHLIDLAHVKLIRLKNKPIPRQEFHKRVYDVGLKVLENEYKQSIENGLEQKN